MTEKGNNLQIHLRSLLTVPTGITGNLANLQILIENLNKSVDDNPESCCKFHIWFSCIPSAK